MINKNLYFLLLFIVLFTSFQSCDEETVVENEEELITTIVYTLTPNGVQGQDIVCTFRDLDGDGGAAPVYTITGPLKTGTDYVGKISLFNDSTIPPDDVTLEVKAENVDHQFFFETGNQLMISYLDFDANNKPVGLETKLTTKEKSELQKLKITLRHTPDKTASGVSDGDITNAGGETDLEISFDLSVQ